MSIVKFTDAYEALGGVALLRAFSHMDYVLWQALDIIAQTERAYLGRVVIEPATREATGAAHGRKWFLGGNSPGAIGALVTYVGGWQRGVDYTAFLDQIKTLGFYRDTIRGWVEGAVVSDVGSNARVREYHRTYLSVRTDITTAYLPLVWSIASHHGTSASEDLYQIGVPGLIHAIERYNNDGPITFGRFASRWIRQAILMHLTRKAPIILVSHSVLERERKIKKREAASGKRDLSEAAEAIRSVSAHRDVSLVADIDVPAEEKPTPRLDLQTLPKDLRHVLIMRYGTTNLAHCNVSEDELDAERKRQSQK